MNSDKVEIRRNRRHIAAVFGGGCFASELWASGRRGRSVRGVPRLREQQGVAAARTPAYVDAGGVRRGAARRRDVLLLLICKVLLIIKLSKK